MSYELLSIENYIEIFIGLVLFINNEMTSIGYMSLQLLCCDIIIHNLLTPHACESVCTSPSFFITSNSFIKSSFQNYDIFL
jgi:hypothetical protein